MNVVIDTSSLISLVRYYLPFDKNKILFKFIKTRIELKEILVLDKVFEECRYFSKGLVINKLTYLNDKNNITKTTDLLPTKKFYNQLENQFVNGAIRNKLTDVEFENRKNEFLDKADCKILLYSLNNVKKSITIVSEETENVNDNKSFKKLPSICKILNLKIITLPELLDQYDEIDFEFK